KIEPLLARVNGVAQVTLVGGQEREIQVSLDQKQLEGYGISVPQVQQAVLASNLDFPTGNIKTRESKMLIRLSGKYRTVEEMRSLVVANRAGVQIRLSDIADVQDSQKEVEKISRVDQKSAIAIQIIKQTDANAVQLSEDVKMALADIEKEYEKE